MALLRQGCFILAWFRLGSPPPGLVPAERRWGDPTEWRSPASSLRHAAHQAYRGSAGTSPAAAGSRRTKHPCFFAALPCAPGHGGIAWSQCSEVCFPEDLRHALLLPVSGLPRHARGRFVVERQPGRVPAVRAAGGDPRQPGRRGRHAGRLPARTAAGQGRHGRGLSGPAAFGGPRGRREGPAAGLRRGPERRRALPAREQAGRQAGPRQYRHHLRSRRGRRPLLPGHGLHRGGVPRPPSEAGRRPARGRGAGHRPRGGGRPGLRLGDLPAPAPRHQAGQHHGGLAPARLPNGSGAGEEHGRGERHDPLRDHPGHAPVHEPRTGPGTLGSGSRQRRLFARGDPVPPGHRWPSLRRRQRPDDPQPACPLPPATAARTQSESGCRLRLSDRADDGQEARGPLRRLARLAGRSRPGTGGRGAGAPAGPHGRGPEAVPPGPWHRSRLGPAACPAGGARGARARG